MNPVLPLLLGAFGAIVAIYLKEAVALALQRRVIAWQLAGYLLMWRSKLVRHTPMVMIFKSVEDRLDQLRTSLNAGTEAFAKEYQAQQETLKSIRDQVRSELMGKIEKGAFVETDEALTRVFSEVSNTLSEQRKGLIDSKTFLSDRDAAVLGRVFAVNVVQFRDSLSTVMVGMEGVFKILSIESPRTGKLVSDMVDQLILSGEDFFVAQIRLQRAVDQMTKRNLLQLSWDVLRGQ